MEEEAVFSIWQIWNQRFQRKTVWAVISIRSAALKQQQGAHRLTKFWLFNPSAQGMKMLESFANY